MIFIMIIRKYSLMLSSWSSLLWHSRHNTFVHHYQHYQHDENDNQANNPKQDDNLYTKVILFIIIISNMVIISVFHNHHHQFVLVIMVFFIMITYTKLDHHDHFHKVGHALYSFESHSSPLTTSIHDGITQLRLVFINILVQHQSIVKLFVHILVWATQPISVASGPRWAGWNPEVDHR